MNTLLTT